jgi:arsenate reductase
MAHTLLEQMGGDRFVVMSAGSHPASRVHPLAIETLRAHGLPWEDRPPRGADGLASDSWDFVITVCDRAREACPIFPGQPMLAHWGMADPAAVEGSDAERRRAFQDAFLLLRRRIELLLALPMAKLERLALQRRMDAIGVEPAD